MANTGYGNAKAYWKAVQKMKEQILSLLLEILGGVYIFGYSKLANNGDDGK